MKRTTMWLSIVAVASGCGGFGDETTAPDVIPTWEGEMRAFFADNCVRCHQSPPRNGAPSTFRFDAYDSDEAGSGLDGAFERRNRILVRAVNERSMPPTGPLPDDRRDLLRAWINAGAPRE